MASVNDEADIDDTPTTGSPEIDGLLTEYHWSFSARVNFQFTIPDSASDYEDTRDLLVDDYPDDNHEGIVRMTEFMADGIRAAIRHYNEILTFTITENADNNTDTQLRYGLADFSHEGDPDRPAYAYTPQDDGVFTEQANWMSGDMFFNKNRFSTRDLPNAALIGTYQYHTILHETGHALGLKHGHEEGHGNGALPAARDSMEFSVMAYRGYIGDALDNDGNGEPEGYEVANGDYAQTLMMLDIRALQHIYGADFTTRSADTTYSWNINGHYFIDNVFQWATANNTIFLTVWDGGGNDTYDFSAFGNNETIDLTPGGWTNIGALLAQLGSGQMARANVFNALMFNNDHRSIIENAIAGSGADTMIGNFGQNRLNGGLGADRIDGKTGGDTLLGGAGDDIARGDTADDFITGGDGGDLINGGEGFDTALYTDAAGANIVITPQFQPQHGRWIVTGPVEAVGDTLAQIEAFGFGNGDDEITVRNGPFTNFLTLDAAGGADVITGSDGAPDAENLTGGAGSDTVVPMAGRFNVYGGRPGAAPLTWIESLADNDLLMLDRTDDTQGFHWRVSFSALSPLGSFNTDDGSTARGFARLDFRGSAFQDLLEGHLGDDHMRGFGEADSLHGDRGNDTLEGGAGADAIEGGDGADSLLGGLGSDFLSGGVGGDVIVTGGGIDQHVLGEAGNDTIAGSADTETVHGGSESDSIDAFGGADVIFGETGNDTIDAGWGDDFVDSGRGVESLDGGSGIDNLIINRDITVLGVSFFLNGAVGSDGTQALRFESLQYTAGRGNDFIRGASGNDLISGNTGLDTLEGGAGSDTLSGNANADTLRGGLGFDDLRGGDGNDRIETGGGGEFLVWGEAGNDTIIGATAGETLQGQGENDSIQGAGGNDFLRGDPGNDTLSGGTGNDTIDPGLGIESLNGGDDFDRLTIDRSSTTHGVTFFLNGIAGSDGSRAIGFELMTYAAGGGADNVRGGDGTDTIAGNGGADTLNGGLGNDSFIGGAGNDRYVFGTALSAASATQNIDRIGDMVVADDTIVLANDVFQGLAGGRLAASVFRAGPVALDANDRILFDGATGALIFDSNGNVLGGATQFATIVKLTGSLSNADFLVS